MDKKFSCGIFDLKKAFDTLEQEIRNKLLNAMDECGAGEPLKK